MKDDPVQASSTRDPWYSFLTLKLTCRAFEISSGRDSAPRASMTNNGSPGGSRLNMADPAGSGYCKGGVNDTTNPWLGGTWFSKPNMRQRQKCTTWMMITKGPDTKFFLLHVFWSDILTRIRLWDKNTDYASCNDWLFHCLCPWYDIWGEATKFSPCQNSY